MTLFDLPSEPESVPDFDLYGAAYMLCVDYHSGQASLGYRLQCWLTNRGYRPGLSVQNHRFESDEQKRIYNQLRRKYAHRL